LIQAKDTLTSYAIVIVFKRYVIKMIISFRLTINIPILYID